MINDGNKFVFNKEKTVQYYADLKDLQKCESCVFNKYLIKGMKILDMGVGGGRTTPFLSSIASEYVGLDYSKGMINLCCLKFPKLNFIVADATDLSMFGDASYDAIIFSFNGIDNIFPDEQRYKCHAECFRVLNENGVFIFSMHNAKALFVKPLFDTPSWKKRGWRVLYSAFRSLRLILRTLPQKAFWQGRGYIVDSVHGGLKTYTSTPVMVIKEMAFNKFEVVEVIGSLYPFNSNQFLTPWYYYVCKKSEC